MQRDFRRIAGFVATWFDRLSLQTIADPRGAQGKRWKIQQVLGACLLGLMAGCRGLGSLEDLTERLSGPVRRRFGLGRRLPDTTMRDVLCRLSWREIVGALHRVVAKAQRGKMLEPIELPFGMVAMDGKGTAVPNWEGLYAQKHTPEEGLPFGLVRTVTSTLVTARGRPCVDVSPIPASTNEMGHFQVAFAQLCEHFDAFKLVSYDQGANSEDNARAVLARGKHYLFRLNDERRHMQQLAVELLAAKSVVAESVEVVSNHEEQVRRLRLFRLEPSGLPVAYESAIWEHARTLLCVEREVRVEGREVEKEQRYYASSLPLDTLAPKQWLWAVRAHWGVETTHQIIDTSFGEDDQPWIRNDPNGMLVLLVLRRIAYTLLTLYRSVTQRSSEKRLTPWRTLLESLRDMLIASTAVTMASLRRRYALKLVAVAT